MSDVFYTIAHDGKAEFREKMSRFIAFAHHISSPDEAREIIKNYQNKYHDARHVCWAYMIGPDRLVWQLSDDGEPSGTAGKPILGQINSANVTDIVVAVVRYFGGIKLGTSGLIAAYREAARLAIDDAGLKECFETEMISFTFPYISMNDVMKIVKQADLDVKEQTFDNTCSMRISVRKSVLDEINGRLGRVSGLTFS